MCALPQQKEKCLRMNMLARSLRTAGATRVLAQQAVSMMHDLAIYLFNILAFAYKQHPFRSRAGRKERECSCPGIHPCTLHGFHACSHSQLLS